MLFRQISLYSLTTMHVYWRTGGKVFTSARAPVPPCVCVFFLNFFLLRLVWFFEGLGDVQGCLAHWKPTAVTDNSFFTHTRKQTVRKCTDTRTGTQKTHTLRQMVRIRPPLNFPFHVHAPALPRQTGRVFHVVTADTRQVSQWRAGLASITNWRVLSQKIITSVCVSQCFKNEYVPHSHRLRVFTFSTFCLNQTDLHPAGPPCPVSQTQTDTHRSICEWHEQRFQIVAEAQNRALLKWEERQTDSHTVK